MNGQLGYGLMDRFMYGLIAQRYIIKCAETHLVSCYSWGHWLFQISQHLTSPIRWPSKADQILADPSLMHNVVQELDLPPQVNFQLPVPCSGRQTVAADLSWGWLPLLAVLPQYWWAATEALLKGDGCNITVAPSCIYLLEITHNLNYKLDSLAFSLPDLRPRELSIQCTFLPQSCSLLPHANRHADRFLLHSSPLPFSGQDGVGPWLVPYCRIAWSLAKPSTCHCATKAMYGQRDHSRPFGSSIIYIHYDASYIYTVMNVL